MINILNKKANSSQTIISFLLSKLKKKSFNFFDVGARNGSFILPEDYTIHTIMYGFEPNQEEYEKLISNNTDANKHGIIESRFKEKKFFNTALYEKKCNRKIYITNGPGAVTLMGPAHKKISVNLSRKFDKDLDYFEKVQKLKEVKSVKCDNLDALWSDNEEYIDFIKLDTEGTELNILKGAEKLLRKKKILMIKSEFFHTPYYKVHSLLGHQQVYLDKLGYRLVFVERDHYGYSWKKSNVNEEYDKRYQYAGDAYYIPDPDLNTLNQEQFIRLGIINIALGFKASGINFLRSSKKFNNEEIFKIEKLASTPSLLRRITNFWKKIPSMVSIFLKLNHNHD